MNADYGADLRATVGRAASALRVMPEADVRKRPAPGKWCAAEIIGHLIDSASNNHQRFVRAMFRSDLRFDGYAQDPWVDVQHYREAPWTELVTLWEAFNLHLARLMRATPASVRTASRSDHNLDQIGWEPVPAEEPVTLEYFMRDYIGHLKHHLRQIDTTLCDEPTLQRAMR